MAGRSPQDPRFGPETFAFLRDLKKHNDRAWFQKNKQRYVDEAQGPSLAFIEAFARRLTRISKDYVADPKPSGGSFFRIYRDTRFAKDKSPYKTNLGIHFRHKKTTRDVHAPGFYLHIEPGGSFSAGGMWHPEGSALRSIRSAIDKKRAAWKKVVHAAPPLVGESLKTAPQGWSAEHPLIEDIRRKDFIATIEYKDKDVTGPGFAGRLERDFAKMSPLNRFVASAIGL